MAGIGSAWGSREEMLHPRDRHGRFRKKWSMAKDVVDALTGFLDRFKPHEFQSDGQAAQYTFNRRKGSWGQEEVRRLHMDWDDANETLQAGEMDATTKRFVEMMDRHMVETTDDLIMSQTVPPEAFGLTAQQAGLEDGGLEDFIGLEIADAGYTAMSIGSELSHPPGSVTLRVAVPKGTRAAFGGRSPNDRGVFLDRDQPLVVTKVQSDGRGGWYVLAIAGSGARTKGATPVADDRTFGRRGPGLTPEQREARIEPRMSAEERLRIGRAQERLAQQETLQGIQARGEGVNVQEPGQAPPAPAPAPAAPASPQATPAPPAVGVPERREPVQSEAVGPGSPEGKAASDIATQAQAPAAAPAAPAVTPAPAGPSPADFKAAAAAADLPAPAAGAMRTQWSKAYRDLANGRRDAGDVMRDLETDIEVAKEAQDRVTRGEDRPRPTLDRDVDALEKLADTISESYGIPRRGRTEAAAPSAPEPTAPSAPRQGPTPTPGAPSTTREATPRAPAPKKAAKRVPQEVADQMKSVGTREEGDALLRDLTGPELHAVAEAAGIPVPKRATKDKLRQTIGQHGYGRRLDSDAISGNGRRMRGDTTTDNERRLIEAAKKYRGKERNGEEERIVAEADAILARRRQEKEGPIKEGLAAKRAAKAAVPETAPEAPAPAKAVAKKAAKKAAPETRSEMRKRTAGPGLTDEQKADIQAKAARADERARKEIEDFDAKNKADLDPLLEAAGLQESDLDELDKTGANLILGQVREKRISKVEGVRRLRNSSSPQLKALGDALAARPRKVAAKKAAVKAVPSAPEAPEAPAAAKVAKKAVPAKAVAKKAVPAKAAPSPVDAEKEALKARVAEAGLPDRVTALRALAKEQKIRGFSTMNKEQLQRALLGEEVSRPGKLGVVTPKKMVPHLEAAKSDQEARALLGDHTLTDLRALAKDDSVGVKLPARGLTKDKAKDAILQAVRGEQEGIQGRTPDTSLEDDLAQLGYISLPGDRGDSINREIDQTNPDSPEALRRHRDNLEALSKQYRKDGDRDAANMAQAAADAMGMRAQTISGVEESTPPVKRVAKKAAPAVPEGEEAPEVERPLEKMLKPELLTLAQREGASAVRPSWTKPRILEEIKRNRRMDSSQRGETDEERLRRELGAVPGGTERDLGPQAGPLRLPDRAPTPEEIAEAEARDLAPTAPAKKATKKAAKKAVADVDRAAETVSGQLKGTFGDQLRQTDAEELRQAVREAGLGDIEGNTAEEIFDNTIKKALEDRMRELGMLPEDPTKPTRAKKRVPEGSVAGPRADQPIQAQSRREQFLDGWVGAGFPDSNNESIDEVASDIEAGRISPEEGIRRLESEISLNKEEIADIDSQLRGTGLSRDEKTALRGTRKDLLDASRTQERASKFLREHFKDEAPVTREELESKLDDAEKAALQRVEVDDLKAAAKAEGLGDIQGDDKDTVVQNIAKKMQAREERARQRQARIDENAKVSEALSNLEQMAQNGGSDRALATAMRRLPKEDQAKFSGDKEHFWEELDDVLRGHGLHRLGEHGSTVPYDPQKHDVTGDIAPGSPVYITRVGHNLDLGNGDKVTFKARAIPDPGGTIGPRKATPSAPEAPAAPAGPRRPGQTNPSAAVLKTGTRILTIQDSDGKWVRTSRKTKSKPITVDRIDRVQVGNQSGYQIHGTDDDGNKVTMEPVFGQNTLTLAPEKGAPSAPKATKAAVPMPEASAVPAPKAAKFLPPLANGQQRKSMTNVEVGDLAKRAGMKGGYSRVTQIEHDTGRIRVTLEDGTVLNGAPQTSVWIGDGGVPEAPAPAKAARPGPISPAEVMGQLSNIENPPSREESKALLERLNGRDIRPMAKELHIPTSGKTNDQIRDEIIEATSGRLADAKVSRGFGGTTPTSVPVRTGETTTEAFERTRAAQAAKKVAKAAVPAKAAPKAVDLDNPTRHNAELIGTGLDLDPDGQDKQWLKIVQEDLDKGTDGRQIADGLRREADAQRTIHNIQEASGGTAGASPEARINRMELMADRLEGVRPLKKEAPAKAVPDTSAGPGKREMDTMQAARAQSDALRDLRNGTSHAEVAAALRKAATGVGAREHEVETVRPLQFTPAERSAMKRSDAKRLRELAAEIQAQGVAQRAEARAAKKAAPKKARPSAADDAVATALMDRIRERDPAVAKAVLAEISPEDRKELDAARARDTERKAAKAAAPKKRTAAEMRRAEALAGPDYPLEQVLADWDRQREERKNLTGPVGEMIVRQMDDALRRLNEAKTPGREDDALAGLLAPELRQLADRLGLDSKGSKATLIQRIKDRVKGREALGASAERAVPKAATPSAGSVDESVPMQPYSKSDNMRMHTDSPTMGLVKMYEAAGRNGSANRMLDLRRRATEKGGATTPQQVVDELKAIRAQETDPKFQRELDRAISANDSPMTPMPDLPADTPPAARDLIERLHAIPYARKGTGEDAALGTVSGDSLVNQVANLLRQLGSGELRTQPSVELRRILTMKVHEMNEPSFRIWELADLLEPVTDDQGRRVPSPLTLALREMRPKAGEAGKA